MKLVTVAGTAAIFFFVATMMPVYAQHDEQGEKQSKPDRPQGRPDKGTPQQQHGPQAEQQQRQQGYKGQQQEHAQQPEQQRQRQQPERQPEQVQRHEQSQPPQQQRVQQPSHSRASNSNSNGRPSSKLGNNSNRSARSSRRERGSNSGDGYSRAALAGARYLAAGSRPTLVLRPSHAGRSAEATAATTSLRTRFSLYFGSQHFFRLRTRPVMYMGYPRFEYGGYSFLLVDPWPEYWSDNWYDSDDVYIDYDDGYYLYNRSYPEVRLAHHDCARKSKDPCGRCPAFASWRSRWSAAFPDEWRPC